MKALLNVYKPECLTPLQIIDQLRLKYPQYKDTKIGYAGRLDPLAHGVLLLMVGEETKQREKYQDLPKIYEFEALLGLQTDTYDLLGLLQKPSSRQETIEQKEKIEEFIETKIGTTNQAYPPFSSKAVAGKPLHWWAKQNRLNEITIPNRIITIYSFELLSMDRILAKELQKKVEKNVTAVQGYFRQKEILETWNSYFSSLNPHQPFLTARFRVSCSSGTYVRGLVHELGEIVGCGALATEIFRTRVGEYTLENSINL